MEINNIFLAIIGNVTKLTVQLGIAKLFRSFLYVYFFYLILIVAYIIIIFYLLTGKFAGKENYLIIHWLFSNNRFGLAKMVPVRSTE